MLRSSSDNVQMIPGEPEAVSVQASYCVGRGWTCAIHVRRQFQTWAEASHGSYEQLSTPELVTLIDAALAAELKL